MPGKKAEKLVPLMVRLPGHLHERLKAAVAEKPGRSLNQELVARLEHSFERDNADDTLERAKGEREGMERLYGMVAKPLGLPQLQAQGTLITPLGSVPIPRAKGGSKK